MILEKLEKEILHKTPLYKFRWDCAKLNFKEIIYT